MDEPRIVLVDLETLPNAKEIIKNYVQLSNYPGITLRASLMTLLCVGWKVFGEKRVNCINAWDFSAWNEDINDDKLLAEAAYDILRDADAIVTHNGTRFDLKFLASRLAFHGLPQLPKITHFDTCQVSRSKLFLHNNKLDTVSQFLGGERKLENGGWDLWVKCMSRDAGALKLMEKYCKQDVVVLEGVFRKLKTLGKLPNQNLFSRGKDIVCPKCGSTRLHARGSAINGTRRYRRYQCQDCGGWARTDMRDEAARAI